MCSSLPFSLSLTHCSIAFVLVCLFLSVWVFIVPKRSSSSTLFNFNLHHDQYEKKTFSNRNHRLRHPINQLFFSRCCTRTFNLCSSHNMLKTGIFTDQIVQMLTSCCLLASRQRAVEEQKSIFSLWSFDRMWLRTNYFHLWRSLTEELLRSSIVSLGIFFFCRSILFGSLFSFLVPTWWTMIKKNFCMMIIGLVEQNDQENEFECWCCSSFSSFDLTKDIQTSHIIIVGFWFGFFLLRFIFRCCWSCTACCRSCTGCWCSRGSEFRWIFQEFFQLKRKKIQIRKKRKSN